MDARPFLDIYEARDVFNPLTPSPENITLARQLGIHFIHVHAEVDHRA